MKIYAIIYRIRWLVHMNNLTCSFSGHRQIYRIHKETLPALLSKTIDDLIASGVSTFCSGGAMGFDLLAARCVLEKRESGANISLRMILPCRNQTSRWPAANRAEHERIISLADEVLYITDKYDQFCMHLRNRALVDTADILLCYLSRPNSGTAYTVNYAGRKDVNIVNLFELL